VVVINVLTTGTGLNLDAGQNYQGHVMVDKKGRFLLNNVHSVVLIE